MSPAPKVARDILGIIWIMSIYTKPVSQLETIDLQELVNERAVENSRLEFKFLVPNKEETLKRLSS